MYHIFSTRYIYLSLFVQNDCTPPKCGVLPEYTDSAHIDVEDISSRYMNGSNVIDRCRHDTKQLHPSCTACRRTANLPKTGLTEWHNCSHLDKWKDNILTIYMVKTKWFHHISSIKYITSFFLRKMMIALHKNLANWQKYANCAHTDGEDISSRDANRSNMCDQCGHNIKQFRLSFTTCKRTANLPWWFDRVKLIRNRTIPTILPSGKNILAGLTSVYSKWMNVWHPSTKIKSTMGCHFVISKRVSFFKINFNSYIYNTFCTALYTVFITWWIFSLYTLDFLLFM